MSRRFESVWILVILQVLVGIVPVRGLVLCAESSGEVRIELAHQDAACVQHEDEATAVTRSVPRLYPVDFSSTRCRDIRLGAGEPEIKSRDDRAQQSPSWLVFLAAPSLTADLSHRPAPRPSGHPALWPVALSRTIVLLV